MADGQVGLERVDVAFAEHRRPELDALRVGRLERLGRMAEQARTIGRIVQPRLGLDLAGPLVAAGDRFDLRVESACVSISAPMSTGDSNVSLTALPSCATLGPGVVRRGRQVSGQFGAFYG